MNLNSKIFLTGHNGMLGSAIKRLLEQLLFENIIIAPRSELDLLDKEAVHKFIFKHKPEYVILAAAKVGGIQANIDNPAVFLYENLTIQNNVIHISYLAGVKKLIFIGSSCIYPRECPQPMKEEYLLTGPLEPTNEAYAIAKIAGLKLCEYYYKQYGFQSICLMPCNLYGPNDSFDLQHSHVLSALVKKFCDAKEKKAPYVELWGTGEARREFMHVDDCAKAVLYFLNNYSDYSKFINVGTGEDITIKDLALLIKEKINYEGALKWDTTKPNGMMRKCMDVTRMKALGFSPSISIEQGVVQMISLYKSQTTIT
jgi:GDP-L-fucose synthase